MSKFRIIRLEGDEDLKRWRASFVGAFQTVFSGPPFFEKIYPAEADGIFRSLTSTPENITLIAVHGNDKIIGFGIAVPLKHHPDIAQEVAGLLQAEPTMYLAELGVLEEYQDMSVGDALVQRRIELIDRNRYQHVICRVSATRNLSYQQYISMGFEDVGVYMEVKALRISGSVTSDRRLFLYKSLKQLDLDE